MNSLQMSAIERFQENRSAKNPKINRNEAQISWEPAVRLELSIYSLAWNPARNSLS